MHSDLSTETESSAAHHPAENISTALSTAALKHSSRRGPHNNRSGGGSSLSAELPHIPTDEHSLSTASDSSTSTSSSAAPSSDLPTQKQQTPTSDHAIETILPEIPVVSVEMSLVSAQPSTSSSSSAASSSWRTAPSGPAPGSFVGGIPVFSIQAGSSLAISSSSSSSASASPPQPSKDEITRLLKPILERIKHWNLSPEQWSEMAKDALQAWAKLGLEDFWPHKAPVTTALWMERSVDADHAGLYWKYEVFFRVGRFDLPPAPVHSDPEINAMYVKMHGFLSEPCNLLAHDDPLSPPSSFDSCPHSLAFKKDSPPSFYSKRPGLIRRSMNPYRQHLSQSEREPLNQLRTFLLQENRWAEVIAWFGADKPTWQKGGGLPPSKALCLVYHSGAVSNAVESMIECVEYVQSHWLNLASKGHEIWVESDKIQGDPPSQAADLPTPPAP